MVITSEVAYQTASFEVLTCPMIENSSLSINNTKQISCLLPTKNVVKQKIIPKLVSGAKYNISITSFT